MLLESQVSKLKDPVKIQEGWFNIVGKSGKCVSAKIKDNLSLNQEDCGNGLRDDLLWNTLPYSNGLIFENKTGRVMDNSQNRNNRGGDGIVGYERNNKPKQIWVFEYIITPMVIIE
jgi:hypothetical protein